MFTVAAHAQSQALLQPAVLAAVAVGAVDEAAPLAGAGVHGVVLLAASEEPLEEEEEEETRRGSGQERWSGGTPAGNDKEGTGGNGQKNVVEMFDLAAFAGDDPIVDPGRLVPADLTGNHLDLS